VTSDDATAPVTHELVGRVEEKRALANIVDPTHDGRRICLVDGPAGAGKTALFDYATQVAAERGATILRAAPAAAEASLPYAALVDLFATVPLNVVDRLPSVQQRAVRATLLHDAADDAPDVQHAVARGFLEALRELAAANTVLVAVDDIHWLDPATARALQFVVRRLGALRVRVLLTRRSSEGEEWSEILQRAVPDEARLVIPLGPLGVDDVARLLESKLGLRLPRPTVVDLHRRSEGNALFALELGRAMRDGTEAANERIGIDRSDDLTRLLAARLAVLSPEARRAVLVSAAASRPSTTLLIDLSGSAGTAEALQSGIIRSEGDRIRFAHPLYASVASSLAGDTEWRRVHAALADRVGDEDESALHRALGTNEPSDSVASELELAAERATARGAPETGAQLAEHAARLTPQSDQAGQRRRLVATSDYLLAAGDPHRARSILTSLVEQLDPGAERADILWRLADAVGDDLPLSVRLAEQALTEAGDDADVKISIHLALATFSWLSGDLRGSAEHCRAAAALAEAADNEQLTAIAVAELAHANAVLGVPTDDGLVERALEIESRLDSFPPGARPSFQLAIVYVYTDRLDEARPLLDAELQRVIASGDESARVAVLFRMAELELRAGNWGPALRRATESTALAGQAGIEQEQCVAQTSLAAVAAHLGRTDEAAASAQRALAIAVANGDRMSIIRTRGVLGFVALSSGNIAAADEWLAPAVRDIEQMGVGELSIYGVVQNQLDALIVLGRLDEASALADLTADKAGAGQRAWHVAVAARARARIAAITGDEEEAFAQISIALDAHERLPQPFELGRTLLAKGSIERRMRRRSAARESINAALEIFDELGAALWAEMAAAELARISGRTARSGELTETEQRVAALVAEGLSNGEVAARLFVTVRTVEAHLSRIYAKLGMRSRVDIARWAGRRADSP
jgi:DNA-binding NarL/FixJ family response regulator